MATISKILANVRFLSMRITKAIVKAMMAQIIPIKAMMSYIEIFSYYSVRKAMTGSLCAAAREGINPEISVRTIDIKMMIKA